jgi:hypothetical protein
MSLVLMKASRQLFTYCPVYAASKALPNHSLSLVLRTVLCSVRSQPLLKPQTEICCAIVIIFMCNKSLHAQLPASISSLDDGLTNIHSTNP